MLESIEPESEASSMRKFRKHGLTAIKTPAKIELREFYNFEIATNDY